MNTLNTAAIERLENRLTTVQDAIEKILIGGQNVSHQAGSIEQAQLTSLLTYERRILSELTLRLRGGFSVRTKYVRDWASLGLTDKDRI